MEPPACGPGMARDGLSHFCFYGICENAAVAVLVLTLAPTLGGVNLEHTHPTQGYLMPVLLKDQQLVKRNAIAQWSRLIASAIAEGEVPCLKP